MRFEGNTRPAWLRDTDIVTARHYSEGPTRTTRATGDGKVFRDE